MADLRETARDPRRDFMQATPREPISGFLSDLTAATYSPERTQQLQGIARFFGIPELSRTLNRLSYGEPITNIGIANVPLIPDDTAGAAMLVSPLAGKAGRVGTKIAGKAINEAMVYGTGPLAKITPQPNRIFIGQSANTWSAAAAQKAKMLEDIGTDPRTIWQQTGTWKGPDGKWRQEISDESSKVGEIAKEIIEENQYFQGPMAAAFENKPLFEAYPELAGINTYMTKDFKGGVFKPNTNEIDIMMPTEGGQRTVALHELQHAVQKKEGFARGGSPRDIGDLKGDLMGMEDKYNFLASEYFTATDNIVKSNILQELNYLKPRIEELQKLKNIDPEEGYMRLAGEAEARATEARKDLTAEQRRNFFPEDFYDRPIEQLIIKNR